VKRQRDKETKRQRDKETKRQRDKETKRQRDKETKRQRDKETKNFFAFLALVKKKMKIFGYFNPKSAIPQTGSFGQNLKY
jgi:hypothetical protein